MHCCKAEIIIKELHFLYFSFLDKMLSSFRLKKKYFLTFVIRKNFKKDGLNRPLCKRDIDLKLDCDLVSDYE